MLGFEFVGGGRMLVGRVGGGGGREGRKESAFYAPTCEARCCSSSALIPA